MSNESAMCRPCAWGHQECDCDPATPAAEPVGGDLGALRAPPSIPAVDGEAARTSLKGLLEVLRDPEIPARDVIEQYEREEYIGAVQVAIAGLSSRPIDREAVADLLDAKIVADTMAVMQRQIEQLTGARHSMYDGAIGIARGLVDALSRSSAPADPITAGYGADPLGGGMHKNPPQEGSK